MLITYWAAKGGSGTTVLAAAHAVRAAATGPTLLVDLDGDLPAALGVAEPPTGVADWLAAGAAVPADALERIAVEVAPDLRLLGRGDGPLPHDRAAVLAGLLSGMPRTVVVDAGSRPGSVARTVARSADRSVLVTHACYLAVRRAEAVGLAPTEIALVRDGQRALGAADLEAALGAPVRTQVNLDPNVARAVDAGLLLSRLPRSLVRAVDRVVDRDAEHAPDDEFAGGGDVDDGAWRQRDRGRDVVGDDWTGDDWPGGGCSGSVWSGGGGADDGRPGAGRVGDPWADDGRGGCGAAGCRG